ncbi:MAG: fibrobacter succinogenes major paralogous domain-containing protein [Saprospiraceae bacterium]|nr:fibrobacter succinogenes major paralogous domain-containing protein [Saprospiraceae bacterium]
MRKKSNILIYLFISIGMLFILSNACKKDESKPTSTPTITKGTVKDIDGNTYQTVKIGAQWWMAENLKTTKYLDGTSIPNVSDSIAWINLTTGAYCDYDNTPSNSDTYGRLYNWYAAVDVRNICPSGWHVPSDAEWTTLTTYLGGESVAGGKLKESGTIHWESPNTGATNESGFSALPGGNRITNGAFDANGYFGIYCSSSKQCYTDAWIRAMSYNYSYVARYFTSRKDGFSVRCVKD